MRYSKFWWSVGWAMVAVVLYTSLKRHVELPDFEQSDKVMHFGAYCTMAFWFAGMTERRRYPILAILLVTLGGLIEILQGTMGFGRSADWRDFLANSSGILVAIGLAYAGLGSWMSQIERRLRI